MFAWLLVTLDIVAAGGYAIQHDWRKMLYWLFCECNTSIGDLLRRKDADIFGP